MSRWCHETQTVTVGRNSQEVRGLTAGELAIVEQAKEVMAAGNRPTSDLPFVVATFGCVNPTVSDEDARSMPPKLLGAIVEQIMSLTAGPKAEEKKTTDS